MVSSESNRRCVPLLSKTNETYIFISTISFLLVSSIAEKSPDTTLTTLTTSQVAWAFLREGLTKSNVSLTSSSISLRTAQVSWVYKLFCSSQSSDFLSTYCFSRYANFVFLLWTLSLFLFQDLIKYTSPDHTDYVILQMAQASIEEIAEFLNEAKKQAEQIAIVHYLSSRIDKLPFRLKETQQVLLRQDSVTWLVSKLHTLLEYFFSQCISFFCRRL